MVSLKRLVAVTISALAATVTLCAVTDSTYIFLGAVDDGNSGLLMYESPTLDKPKWSNRGINGKITGSDFGAWGSGKKMYFPTTYRDSVDGRWLLIFNPVKDGSVSTYTMSSDLTRWSVQEFDYPENVSKNILPTMVAGEPYEMDINGKTAHGSVLKVERSVVDNIRNYQRYRQQLEARNNERTADDVWRFAGIDTVTMTLTPLYDEAKSISDKFVGIFFEDINYAADGGLYAELIQNRDFEYRPDEPSRDKTWTATKAWSLSDSTKMKAVILTDSPLSKPNEHYMQLTTTHTGQQLLNEGFDGIAVKKNARYNISMWVKSPIKNSIKVTIIDSNKKPIGQCNMALKTTGEWIKVSGTIKATDNCANSRLAISLAHAGVIDLDMVSMMPTETFNGRHNGLRKDLAQVLADLKPRFVRFPGGCIAHGNGVDNMYDWKGSIGNLEDRTPKRNLWGYHQTRGLGYYEFFLMCEDFGAEPLPVLAAGVPCQNSSRPSHHSHDALTSNGQQCGIPMEEMGQYIQDILDLIEYANGDSTTTWGSKRAMAGHPEPFNLKMIGIGNEDIITNLFKERFLMIYNAIKDRYPDIEVVGTVGPFYEGADYDAGWELANQYDIPIVDEHYYVSPGWLIHNGDYYDNYRRNATKVYLGEYASHLPDRASTLEAALSNALYLSNVERNADVVTMTSYAPLLAKQNHTQWRPDLIYFNNTDITLTPDYYVQKMYGNNAGTTYIPTHRVISNTDSDLAVRLGNSIVTDSETGDMIVKLVNMTPAVIKTNLGITGSASLTLLKGDPNETNAREEMSEIEVKGTYTQPPYSFSVLRFKNK